MNQRKPTTCHCATCQPKAKLCAACNGTGFAPPPAGYDVACQDCGGNGLAKKPEAQPYWGAPDLAGRRCSCAMTADLERVVRTAPAMFGPCRCARCGGDIGEAQLQEKPSEA